MDRSSNHQRFSERRKKRMGSVEEEQLLIEQGLIQVRVLLVNCTSRTFNLFIRLPLFCLLAGSVKISCKWFWCIFCSLNCGLWLMLYDILWILSPVPNYFADFFFSLILLTLTIWWQIKLDYCVLKKLDYIFQIEQEELKLYAEDGSVDINGNPPLKHRTGNWKACPFILGQHFFFNLLLFSELFFFLFDFSSL